MPLGESMSPGTGTGLGMALSTYPSGIILLIKSNESLTRTSVALGLLDCCNAPLPADDNSTNKHTSQRNARPVGRSCA